MEHKRIADFVVEDFESKVRSGELKKGDKLPNENDYAKQLGISRISLREAIQALRAMGAVVQKPKVGTVIVCDNPNLWIRQPSGDIIKDPEAIVHLMDARLVIEPAVTHMCVERIDEASVKELRRLVDEQISISRHLETVEDYERYVDCDVQFHLIIAIAGGNPFLAQMYASVLQSTRDFIMKSFYSIPVTVGDANELHQKICTAIERRDADEAASLMERHIRKAADNALKR